MNLYVWPSYKNVESFDPESLSVITYTKIARTPMNIFSDLTPWYNANYTRPFLKHSINESRNLKEIIPYFRKENYGVEYNLSDDDLALLNMLSMNIHQDLIPAVQFLMWFDDSNFNTVTRPIVGTLIGLPMSLIWPNLLRKRMITTISSSRLSFLTSSHLKISTESMKTSLYDSGKRCLTSLEYILNESEFFVSKKATYIEAVLYGYLWPVINLGYESDALLNHLRQCYNLMEMLNRIHRTYYPHLTPIKGADQPPESMNRRNNLFGRSKQCVSDNWIQIRNSCVFVVIVSSLMICYTKYAQKI